MTQETLYSTSASTLEVNKLLKNTYMLLSMTLAFSALCAVSRLRARASAATQRANAVAVSTPLVGAGLLSRPAM